MNDRFLDEVRRFFQIKYVIPVGSGTVGLFLALLAINVRNRKVIIPILTCPNVAIAILAAGGIPLAVDVSDDNYNIDPNAVARALDKSVKAIIAIDSFGYPANIHALRSLTSSRDCVLIEDACQAYGGQVDGEVIGGRGDIGVISFGYSKPLALNGGGLLLTNSQDIYTEINSLQRSSDFNFLRATKNKLALELMLKGRYGALQFLSQQMGLLRYGMPPRVEDRLPQSWQKFTDELEQVKINLTAAMDLISASPFVEPFKYESSNWLPWRYSFKIVDLRHENKLIECLQQAEIKITSLYKPLTNYLDLEVCGPLDSADSLKYKTRNLYYQNTESDTQKLVEKLKRFLSESTLGSE